MRPAPTLYLGTGGEIRGRIGGTSGEGGSGAAEGDPGCACSGGDVSDVAWAAGANANADADDENLAHAAASFRHAYGAVAEFADEKGDGVVV